MGFTGGATAVANNSVDQVNNSGITINSVGGGMSRTLYWVGGTGNWNDINRWSLTSGGAGGQCPPTSIDDVIFNGNSFAAAGQIVTINVPNADCRSMTWTGVLNTPSISSSSSANNMNIYGSLTLAAGMNWTTNMNVYFMGTGIKTIDPFAKTFGTVFINGTGTWSNLSSWTTGTINLIQAGTLQVNQPIQINGNLSIDNNGTVNMNATSNISSWVYLNWGSWNTNGSTVNLSSFRSRPCNTNPRAMNLGSSTINVSGNWEVADFNYMTLNGGTSTINMNGLNTTFNNWLYCYSGNNNVSYYNVNFTASSGTVNFNHEYSSSTNRIYGNYNQVTFGAGANITGEFTVGTSNFAPSAT
jgi:hypothetical protein